MVNGESDLMRRTARRAVVALVALTTALAGCASDVQPEKEQAVTPKLTWQEAKASTQAMELEIAGRIPKEKVVAIEQKEEGTLFSCDSKQHTWLGVTIVRMVQGAEIEPIVKAIEAHYADSRYRTDHRLDVRGIYEASVSSPSSNELYLIDEGDPSTVRISSVSPCFTLPEGMYPGGLF